MLPDTLGLGPEVWRVLSKCHDMRNRTEYEGALDVDDRLVSDLIAACRKVADEGQNVCRRFRKSRSEPQVDMALKKSELYSSLWSSCDELRGGMDASQYKDYVLVLLFIKYVSDKYAGQPYAPITIPPGASFEDMVALKGKTDIGDQINKKIIAPLANANKLSDLPDFNDAAKLGSGKEMVDRLTNLIAIFENPALDFSKNRADGDDILGDAYEYLMRHFATESGKSKGQFYTPAEVSRIMAQIIGIHDAKTSAATTVYDPTCGSGLLLRNSKGPLVIDQPEDNLDNRYIADIIAPDLLQRKRGQQDSVTSHNANLVVLTDADMIAHVDADWYASVVSCGGFPVLLDQQSS